MQIDARIAFCIAKFASTELAAENALNCIHIEPHELGALVFATNGKAAGVWLDRTATGVEEIVLLDVAKNPKLFAACKPDKPKLAPKCLYIEDGKAFVQRGEEAPTYLHPVNPVAAEEYTPLEWKDTFFKALSFVGFARHTVVEVATDFTETPARGWRLEHPAGITPAISLADAALFEFPFAVNNAIVMLPTQEHSPFNVVRHTGEYDFVGVVAAYKAYSSAEDVRNVYLGVDTLADMFGWEFAEPTIQPLGDSSETVTAPIPPEPKSAPVPVEAETDDW